MHEINAIKRPDGEPTCICYQMSRMLAAKAALAIRVDALGEDTNVELGMEHRAMLEKRMRSLEEGKVGAPWVLGSACQ